MARQPCILALAGSTRKDSFNKKLVQIAAQGAREAGAQVTCFDLRDHPLPLFDQDIEAENGKPDHARKLKKLMVGQDGFLISSPEYNSSISGVLKNAIDWVSRPDEGEDFATLAAFRGKVVTLMSASPGALGGLRGLVHVRDIFGNVGSIVLPDQVAVSNAHQAFDGAGALVDEKQQQRILNLGQTLAQTISKIIA